MPNLIPQSIEEWMRRVEFKVNDLTRRMSSLIPGDIADGVDLNGFMSTGRFRRPSVVGTTTALNYPFAGASGTLEVYWEPSNAQVHQIWYDRSGTMFSRWWNGSVWSSWEGDTGWVSLTNATGWNDFSGNDLEVRRIGKSVRCRGRAERTGADLVGTATSTMATIPAGYRPNRVLVQSGMTNGDIVTGAASAGTAHTHPIGASTTAGPMLRLVINTSGTIEVLAVAGVTIQTGRWMSLDEISFFLD